MNIGTRRITAFERPYIIAEIGVNHEGSLSLAKRLIEEAKEAGADAAKFQTYKAETIASRNSPAYWDTSQEATRTQYELFQKYDKFGPSEYRQLASHCQGVGIDFLSTPFDREAVELLAPLVPAFKLASADITNIPLLRQVAAKKKPIIMSTGASTLDEIESAVKTVEAAGCESVALLHCVLNYPTPPGRAQLRKLSVLRSYFPGLEIGYSDHVPPDGTLGALEVAFLAGASILEKHFTHDKTLPGNDHYHAMDAMDLRRLVQRIDFYLELLGDGAEHPDWEEAARTHARRSIVAARRIEEGEVFSEENLMPKRPGSGISPTCWDEIIGLKAMHSVEADQLIEWGDIDNAD